MKKKFSSMWRVGLALVMVLSLNLVMAAPVSATATVTAATEGDAISADTATDATTPAWTDLGTITIAEVANDDFAASQSTVTLILNAPAGFEFNASQTPSISGTSADITLLTLGITTSAITVTFTTAVTTAVVDTIVIGAAPTIQVRPTTGVLPASGNILRDVTSDSTIIGVDGSTNFGTLTMVAGALEHFDVAPATTSPVVGDTVTLTVTAEDQFDNALTTYSESLFLSQTGAGTPALITWSGADVTNYGDGTGRFTGTWTNAISTVDVSYTIASDAVILKVTGDSTGKLGSAAAVTWQSVEITDIVGTTYQNGNDTILITFGTEVQPADLGPWDAAVFTSIKHGSTSVSLVGASFTPASGLTNTLTITLDEAVAYLVNTETVYVTPAFEAIKGTAGVFVPSTEQASAAPISGDSVAPTVALTYSPADRDVKDADTLTITATFSEAMQATPQIEITGVGILAATDMTGSGATWTYAYNVPAGTDGTATVVITGDDLAGNAMTDSSNTFVIDNTVPTIAVNAVVGSTTGTDTIVITFSEAVDATDADFTDGDEVSGITLKKNGETDVTVNLTGATFAYTGSTLTITLAETGNVQDYLINGYMVTYDPSDTNTIEDGALNLLDTAAIDGTTLVTGDAAGPTMVKVVGMIKTGDDTVTITFSEKVRPADGTWSANEVSIESPATAPLNIDHAGFALDATNTILTITLNQATDGAFLVMGDAVKVYRVTSPTDAVLDLAGNAVSTASVSSSAIADPTYPYITSIVGTSIQDAGDTIIITFSEAVKPADETWSKDEFTTIKRGTTTLTLNNATFAPATGFTTALTITLDEATDANYLVNGDPVLVTPAATIEDADDNTVPTTEVESAAVVSGDTVAPTIVGIVATLIPGTSAPEERDIIRIDFSEAVVPDDNTWSDNEFAITGAGVDLSGATFAPTSGITTTLTIILLVTEPLTAGTLTVTPVVDKVVDLAGNKMAEDVDSTAPVQVPPEALVIDLEADWNLISLPLVPTDASIETVLAGLVNAGTVIQVRAFNAISGTWGIWASTGPYASNPTLTEMNDGRGFWVEMSAVDNLVAIGSVLPAPPATPPTYSVYEGWNLIGFKSLTDSGTLVAYLGNLVDGSREAIYSYNAGTDLYEIPTTDFEPGKGYWLAVNADGTIYP